MSIRDLGPSLVNIAQRLEQAARPVEQKIANAVQGVAQQVETDFRARHHHHPTPTPAPTPGPTPGPTPTPTPTPTPSPVPTPVPTPGPVPDPRASVTPAGISDVDAKYGWASGSWQDKLMQAADKASATPDGTITAAKLDAYLAAPTDAQFMSSSALYAADKAAATGTHAVDGFDSPWMNNLVSHADSNHDGQVTGAEMHSYVQTVVAGKQSNSLWLPDQKLAPLDSELADMTGEKDMLSVSGGTLGQDQLINEKYMRIVEDPQKRTPAYVSYALTAADIAEGPGATRKDNFRPDPQMPDGPTPGDYKGSGYDRGHNKPSSDSVNVESMDETFLMTNMTPQQGALNQRSWQLLEAGTNELVQATGAKATICTGPLYLDKNGQPLPPDQIKWVGAGGQKRVAVPTEYFKAVCLTMPDGSVKTYAYVLPNDPNLSNNRQDEANLVKANAVSVDQVEQLMGGTTLFQGLDPAVAATVNANAHPDFSGVDLSKYPEASLIWGGASPAPAPAPTPGAGSTSAS